MNCPGALAKHELPRRVSPGERKEKILALAENRPRLRLEFWLKPQLLDQLPRAKAPGQFMFG